MELAVSETAFALVPITLVGSILNWAIFYSIHKLSSFENSFGYLSANQAFTDALHSTIFLLYFCPMVLLNQPIMKEFSHHCGFLVLFCYELSVMTHLAISLNRFAAAWSPYSYDSMFSRKKTKILIVFLWVFTGSVAYLFYQRKSGKVKREQDSRSTDWCHLHYEEKTHFFTFTNTKFCGLIGWYGDFLKNAAIVSVIVCIDILTVLRVRKITRQVSTGISVEAQHKFSARDIRFLKQTVFQGAVFMSELLTYFFFPIYFQNPWVVFFGTSFAWVAVHAADGMVVIVCNPEVRRYLLCRKTKHQLNTITRSHNTEHI